MFIYTDFCNVLIDCFYVFIDLFTAFIDLSNVFIVFFQCFFDCFNMFNAFFWLFQCFHSFFKVFLHHKFDQSFPAPKRRLYRFSPKLLPSYLRRLSRVVPASSIGSMIFIQPQLGIQNEPQVLILGGVYVLLQLKTSGCKTMMVFWFRIPYTSLYQQVIVAHHKE